MFLLGQTYFCKNFCYKTIASGLFASAVMSYSFAGAQTSTSSQASSDYTLTEIINQALGYHPQLSQLRAELDVTKEDIALAKSAYRPQISASGSASISDRNSVLQNGTSFKQDTSPRELSLQLSQTLYDGGRRSLTKQSSQTRYMAAKAQYDAQAIIIADGIIRDYVSLMSAERSYEILSQSVRSMSELVTAIKSRERAGDSSKTDIALTTARLASAQAQLSSARAELIMARDNVYSKSNYLVNRTSVPSQAQQSISRPRNDMILELRDKSASVKSARLSAKEAELNMRNMERAWRPTISLDASARSIKESSPTINQDDDLRAGISVRMPLYQGGAGRSNIRRAQAQITAAQYNILTVSYTHLTLPTILLV